MMRTTLVAAGMLLAALPVSCLALDASACVAIANDAARLRCYDEANRRTPLPLPPAATAAPAQAAIPVPALNTGTKPESKAEAQAEASAIGKSVWEKRIADDASREVFQFTSYRPSYLLYTYMSPVNQTPYNFIDANDRVRNTEAKFQISLQTKAIDNLFGGNGDLWLAYTQVSYWQIGNKAISSPFRETNHEPEAYLSFLTDYDLAGFTMRNVNFGADHQSNGQARPLSRSWNRLFAEFQVFRGDFGMSFKPWYRLPEKAADDDNPDIQKYLGRYEFRAFYEHKRQLYGVVLRNVFDHQGRYNSEFDWSVPLAGNLRAFVQFYSGYGESLIDYNHRQNRIGLGVLLSDWR
jgi:phospholipase A1